jgi:hypothetical protein
MAARFAADNFGELSRHEPEIPDELYNRTGDNCRPLLAIADLAGGDWPEDARWAVEKLAAIRVDDNQSIGVSLLADIRRILDDLEADKGGDKRIASNELVMKLVAIEGAPWSEWQGTPITANWLARALKPFEVRPEQLWMDDANIRGYRLSQFEDLFLRYLKNKVRQPLDR